MASARMISLVDNYKLEKSKHKCAEKNMET